MIFFNLLSPVNSGNIDSVYVDATKYNGRKINQDTNSYFDLYVESLGKTKDQIYYDPTTLSQHYINLVYYKKGNEVWGNAIPLHIDSKTANNRLLKVYPNPVTDNFNLLLEQSPTENYELSIYSSSGALVKQKQLSAFSNQYNVNIQDLKSGVYFVRLESDGEIVYNGKFIKQ